MKLLKSAVAMFLVMAMLPFGALSEGQKRGLKKGDTVTSTVSDNYAGSLNVSIYNESGEFESGIDSMSDINDTDSETGFNFADFDLSEDNLFINGTTIPIKVIRKGDIASNAFGDSEDEVYEFEQGLIGSGDTLADILGPGYDDFVKEVREKTIDTFEDMVDDMKDTPEDIGDALTEGRKVLADILEMSGVRRKNMQEELDRAITNAYDTLQTWAMDIDVPVQTITDEEMWRRVYALRAQMIAEAERVNTLVTHLNTYATGRSQIVMNDTIVEGIQSGEGPVQISMADGGSSVAIKMVGNKNIFGHEAGIFRIHNTGAYSPLTNVPGGMTSYEVATEVQSCFVSNVERYDPTAAASTRATLTGSEYRPTAEEITWETWKVLPLDVKATYPEEVRMHFSQYDALYSVQRVANGEGLIVSENADAAIEEISVPRETVELTPAERKMLSDPNNAPYFEAMENGSVPSFTYVTDPLIAEGQKSFGEEVADIIDSEVLPYTVYNLDSPEYAGKGYEGASGTLIAGGNHDHDYLTGHFGDLTITPEYDREAFIGIIDRKRAEYAAAGKVFDLDPSNPDHDQIVEEIQDAVIQATPAPSTMDSRDVSVMGFDTSDISYGEISIPENAYNYKVLPRFVTAIEEAHEKNMTPGEIGRIIDGYTFYDNAGNPIDMTPLKNQILGRAEAGEEYRIFTATSTEVEGRGFEYGYVDSNPSVYISPFTMDESIIDLNAAMKGVAEENGMDTSSVGIGSLQIPSEQAQIDGFASMTTELGAAISDPTVDIDAIVEKYSWLTLYDESGNPVSVSDVGAVYKTAQASASGVTGRSEKLAAATTAFAESSSTSPVQTQSQDNLSNMAFDIEGFMYLAEDTVYPSYEQNTTQYVTIYMQDKETGEIIGIKLDTTGNEHLQLAYDWYEGQSGNHASAETEIRDWAVDNRDAIVYDVDGKPVIKADGTILKGSDFLDGKYGGYRFISVGSATRVEGQTPRELWATAWQDEELWEGVWDDGTYLDYHYFDGNGHSNETHFTVTPSQTGFSGQAKEHRGNGYIDGNANVFTGIGGDGGAQADAPKITVKSPNASQEGEWVQVDAVSQATFTHESYERDGIAEVSILELLGNKEQGFTLLSFGATGTQEGTTVYSDEFATAWIYYGVVDDKDYRRLIGGSHDCYIIQGPDGQNIFITRQQAERLVLNMAKKIAHRYGYGDEVAEELVKCMIIPTQGNQTEYFSVVIDERKLLEIMMPTSPLGHGDLCKLLGIEMVPLGDLLEGTIPVPTITVDSTQVTTDTMKTELETIYETYIHGYVKDEEYKWMVPVIDLALDIFGTEEEKAEHEERVARIERETGKKVIREEYSHSDDNDTDTDTDKDNPDNTDNPENTDSDQDKPDDTDDTDNPDDGKVFIETSQDLIDYLISMGIDPSTIPEEITIEWLKENLPPEEYTTFFGNVEFKMTRYTRIQRSNIKITETDAYKRKNSSYIWTVIGDGTQLFHQSSPQTSVTVVLYNTVTEVSADIDVMRYCTTTVSYCVMDCVTIDALDDLVVYSKIIQGDGENGLTYKRVDIVDCDPINVLYDVYVIEEEEETNEDNGGWPNGGGGDGDGDGDGDGNGDNVYTIILRIIHTLDSISGKWYNGMRRDEYNGLIFFYYVFNTNQSYTYRVN